jgi:hypothetical protein
MRDKSFIGCSLSRASKLLLLTLVCRPGINSAWSFCMPFGTRKHKQATSRRSSISCYRMGLLERTHKCAPFISCYFRHRCSDLFRKLVYVFLNISGADQRQDDLFSTESLLAKGRSALKGLKVLVAGFQIASPNTVIQH